MSIHHPHQRGALAGKILEAEQGNPAEFIRAQGGFHFGPVALQGVFPGSADHPRPKLLQPGSTHFPFHMHEVAGFGYPVIIPDFPEIRKHFILADLKGKDRLIRCFPEPGHCRGIIRAGTGFSAVQPALEIRRAGAEHLPPVIAGSIEIVGGIRSL